MRKYNPNPKHELSGTQGRKGTKLDLSLLEAERLLNDPLHCLEVPGKRQLVGVFNGRIYVFQDDGTGGIMPTLRREMKFTPSFPPSLLESQVCWVSTSSV